MAGPPPSTPPRGPRVLEESDYGGAAASGASGQTGPLIGQVGALRATGSRSSCLPPRHQVAFMEDDCRAWKIEIHAGSSEAEDLAVRDAEEAGRGTRPKRAGGTWSPSGRHGERTGCFQAGCASSCAPQRHPLGWAQTWCLLPREAASTMAQSHMFRIAFSVLSLLKASTRCPFTGRVARPPPPAGRVHLGRARRNTRPRAHE